MASTNAQAVRVTRALRVASLAIVAGYAAALCYRAGVARALLPRRLNASLERVVHTLQAHSEPLGNPRRLALARQHLVRVYAWTGGGVCAMVAGAALFACFPYVPLWLPLSTSLAPGALVFVVPPRLVRAPARALCFFATWLSVGYAAGPLAYIAQDSLVVPLWLTVCTLTGLIVPLFVTRGVVSYMLSTQLLPSALALAVLTSLSSSTSSSPRASWRDALRGRAPSAMRVVLDGNVYVLLTMQLFANVGMAALHTLPTWWRLVMTRPPTRHGDMHGDKTSRSHHRHRGRGHDVVGSSSGEDDDDDDEAAATTVAMLAGADAMREAFCICAGVMYVSYRCVRGAARLLIRRVLADDGDEAAAAVHETRPHRRALAATTARDASSRSKRRWWWWQHGDDYDEHVASQPAAPLLPSTSSRGDASGAEWPRTRSAVWTRLTRRSVLVERTSGVVSGLVMVLWYVKAVSYLQRGQPHRVLDKLRTAFVYASPMTWLLGHGVPSSVAAAAATAAVA